MGECTIIYLISASSIVGGLACFLPVAAGGCSLCSWDLSVLAAFHGDKPRGHPTKAQAPLDEGRGVGAASLPRQAGPGCPLMSWKVGRQLLALTGAG